MAGQPFKRGQGRCIFCGSTGLTKEHMWADWLRSYIPRELTGHRVRVSTIHFDQSKEETIFQRTGDPHSRRIRCVCLPCNTGWMSRLQENAKPFLIPPLRGEGSGFHRRAQTAVSAWIAMMVMVAEHIAQGQVAIAQSDRNYLREHGVAPPHWRIWIAKHARKTYPLFTHNVMSFGTKEEFERLGGITAKVPSNTQTTTICLGKYLLVHIMSSDVAWSIVRRLPPPPPIADAFNQIWPIKTGTLRWPGGGTLNDAGIDLVANDFFNRTIALSRRYGGSA